MKSNTKKDSAAVVFGLGTVALSLDFAVSEWAQTLGAGSSSSSSSKKNFTCTPPTCSSSQWRRLMMPRGGEDPEARRENGRGRKIEGGG
eukprot:2962757-Rhodomonas_salina.2